MVFVCPMDAERELVPYLGAQVIGLGSSCTLGLDRVASAGTDPVLVIGLAGSLTPTCKPGSVHSIGSVIDSAGRIYESSAHSLLMRNISSIVRIACADHLVCTPAEKNALAIATGASLVDMESAHVARWCVARGRPWGMIRAVLDGHLETLPAAVGSWCGPDGRLQYFRVLTSLLANPLVLGRLPWLARARAKAAAALQAELGRC